MLVVDSEYHFCCSELVITLKQDGRHMPFSKIKCQTKCQTCQQSIKIHIYCNEIGK